MFIEKTACGFDEEGLGTFDRGAGDDGSFFFVAFDAEGDGGGFARDRLGEAGVLEGLIEVHRRGEEVGFECHFVSAFEVHAKVELHRGLEIGEFDKEGGLVLEEVDGRDGEDVVAEFLGLGERVFG